jgi:membrane protein YdbS with pleckstrin-like domain
MRRSSMALEDRNRFRAQRIRVFTIGAVVWVVIAVVFAVIEYTTTLNGWSGMMTGVILALLFAGVAIGLRSKQSQRR